LEREAKKKRKKKAGKKPKKKLPQTPAADPRGSGRSQKKKN